ncbi:MAG: pyridoxal phosphate-dependent aminotransferase [Clostridiales bacterium]|nr:pyridoxal phosphate-dependent aminotransferase [Clostridiales bacterium]
MQYDFDRIIDRTGTGSWKWKNGKDMLPMWVADMDFETCPKVKEALQNRAAHGIYGYSVLGKNWHQAYMSWWKERHDFEIEKEWLVFVTGVIPAISAAVRKLTTPGENVLIQTPVYPVFFNSIENNGRNVLENRLLYDRETVSYRIDWEDLKEKLADPQTTLMILCNPQNPSGNIWDKETLQKIGELCYENHVIVISDEIHCDLVVPGCGYIPFASVSDINKQISVTCVAPTKTFNIAGIQTAAVIVPNKDLRHKMWRGINTDEVGEGNCFSVTAVESAFTKEGGQWLDALREYVFENRRIAEEFIGKNISSLRVIPSSATYLMWVDCERITEDADQLVDFLEKEAKLMLNSGVEFGGNGKTFVRINLACPRSMLEDGLLRLQKGITLLQK